MKLLLKGLLILLCVVTTTSTVFAQQHYNNYNVKLKSGTRMFPNNIDDFINAPNLTALELKSKTASSPFLISISYFDLKRIIPPLSAPHPASLPSAHTKHKSLI